VSIWYHYTHGELLDGAGHGVDLFIPSKQAGIKSFVDGNCWAEQYPDLVALGSTVSDVFLSSYASNVGAAAAGGDNCMGDATCETWTARMIADWPHLQGTATKVPILLLYGKDDLEVTPDVEACTVKRFMADQATFNVCYDADPVGHHGIVSAKADYVADWIAAQTLGAQAPAQCPLNQSGVVNDAGAPIACNALIPAE
jgi:hypothetical protein